MGKFATIASITTQGLGGVPIVCDTVELTTTASIGTTNFTNTGTAGYYLVDGYVAVTSGGALGAITVTLGWTDAIGATTLTPISSFAATGTGRTYFSSIPIRTASGSISFATTVVGSPTYIISLTARRMY